MITRPLGPITESDMRRFWAKVNLPDGNGCLTWRGSVSKQTGYARFGHEGRTVLAHRFAYTALVGPIPGRLVLDHLCRNRRCVAPEHLEAVTNEENIRRGNGGKPRADKTHCPAGHPYSGENLLVTARGSRECRTCIRDRARKRDGWKGNPPSGERTHCPQGHPYSGENLYLTPAGKRRCRACVREVNRVCRARRRVAKKEVAAA